MATKNKTKNKENDKEIEYLEKLIKYSARCLDDKYEVLDSIFVEQIYKLKKEINKIKEKQ